MLVNRVSDTFLFISIMLMWWYLGSTDYTIFLFNTKEAYYLDWICLTMMLGAAGKSAQIGLHTWLADAMEGRSQMERLKPTHSFCFSNFKQNNISNKKLINLFTLTFKRNFSRNIYNITKSEWYNVLPVVLGCLLSGNAIRPPSPYIPSYITFRHNNKQIIEIVSKQISFLLRENHQIFYRKNFYYYHCKPLSEITGLFYLWYQKDNFSITRRKDGWVNKNNALLFDDLFVKCFNSKCLVFWFLLCGTFYNQYNTVMFNIDFYTKTELLHLSTLIENKCNIKTIIKAHITKTKTIYYLYISDQSLNDFISLINIYYDSNLIIKKPGTIYTPGSKQYSILIGLMLGDGCISLGKGSTGTARRYEHTCKHREMLVALSDQWLPLFFNKSSVATPWPKNQPTQWWRGSKMLPELFDLYNLWYKPCVNGKKVKNIPLNVLENHFNHISLAHWFMDDGYFDNYSKTFRFCTDNFTLAECEFLVKLLHNK